MEKGQTAKHERQSGYYWIRIANMPFSEPAFYDSVKYIWRVIGDTTTYNDSNLESIGDSPISEPQCITRKTDVNGEDSNKA